MATNNKIKVIGYAQRTFYNNGVEYRNFTEDLVGNQQTDGSDGESSIFTFGNFVTTTNYDGKETRIFSSKKYSDYYCLENLNLTSEKAKKLLNNNINVSLNLDNTDLCNFTYFGSSTEFVRVSLENIITNWPASLYVDPIRNDDLNTITGPTVLDYNYDYTYNRSTFKIDTNFISNKFNINYKENGTIIDTFNEGNDLRNLTVNYSDYVIYVNGIEYPILLYTGSTYEKNDYIYVDVLGNPFGVSIDGVLNDNYHIKPKKEVAEEFFNGLSEFEDNLLSRLTNPKYSSTYTYQEELDSGVIITKKQKLTWPVTDGYNIDYDSTSYTNYAINLLKISDSKDNLETNLITRFLTSESISDFDTVPNCEGTEEETAGQKMNKTLKIYGREFDEIKKYIDGISFANVVSYDKKENTPDQLVKYLARVLGWELTSSLIENNLLDQYLKVSSRTYPGYSRGLTPAEAEVELWRRLILNSAWIWKSKGTRKSVEFFFSLIGAPDGLINFDEHVYVADAPIDMDLFYATLENNNLPTNLSGYSVDSEGYPKFFRDNSDMYFQKGGQWYRETAGPGASQYTLQGNNPHVGPYDGGKEYIAQLENIIPNFTAFTLTTTTTTTGSTQLFRNYNAGVMNQYIGPKYVDIQNDDGVDLSDLVLLTTYIDEDPCPTAEETECGCDVPQDDESLFISVSKADLTSLQQGGTCEDKFNSYAFDEDISEWLFDYKVYDPDGEVSTTISKESTYVSKECCDLLVNGNSYYSPHYANVAPQDGQGIENPEWLLVNEGYICCKSEGIGNDFGSDGCGCTLTCQWRLTSPHLSQMYHFDNAWYLQFTDPVGNQRVVNKSDSCFCPTTYTTPSVITDPFTGEIGYGCKLNDQGEEQAISGDVNGQLNQIFLQRSNETIGCKSEFPGGFD